MKRILLFIVGVFMMVGQNGLVKAWDSCPIRYEYVENGVHYGYAGWVYENSNECNLVLEKLWHDLDCEVPEVVCMPKVLIGTVQLPWGEYRTFKCDKFALDVANENISEELTTFRTVDFGNYYQDNDDLYGLKVVNLLAEKFISTSQSIQEIDGALYIPTGYQDLYSKYYYNLAFPVLAEDKVSYSIPTIIRPSYPTRFIMNKDFRRLRYPIFIGKDDSGETQEVVHKWSFVYYPFCSIIIPNISQVEDINISNSHIKTIEKCGVFTGASKLEAVKFSRIVPEREIKNLYNPEFFPNLRFVEFDSEVLPNIENGNEFGLSGDALNDTEEKIVTYVLPELVDDYKALQNAGLFATNTIIKPTENFVYVSDELENGQWVEEDGVLKSQFIYAACSFGESKISEVKWESSGEGVLVNGDGIVTIEKSRLSEVEENVEIQCIITDLNGNSKVAKAVVDVRNPEWSDKTLGEKFADEATYFTYNHFADGINYEFLVKYRNNNYSATLVGMWHEENLKIPEEMVLPSEIKAQWRPDENSGLGFEEDSFVIKSPYRLCLDNSKRTDAQKTFNVVNLGGNRFSEREGEVTPSLDLIATGFVSRIYDNIEGALLYKNNRFEDVAELQSLELNEIVAVPVLADNVSLTLTDKNVVFHGHKVQTCLHYPVVGEELSVFSDFRYYPFISVALPDDNRGAAYSIAGSKIRAFDRALLDVGGATELEAVVFPLDYPLANAEELIDLYNSSQREQKLKYIEFKTTVLPEIYLMKAGSLIDEEDIIQSFKELEGEAKVITFVASELVTEFKKLQSRGLFPGNAEIRSAQDMIYLCETLDQGQWVKSETETKSQFIYAACRFGNVEITDVKWDSSHDLVKVDDKGLVSIVGKPTSGEERSVQISCTITGSDGSKQTAIKSFELDESICPESGIIEPIIVLDPMIEGVYNLQGIKVGDEAVQVPAGIYIVNGRKVVVK